MPFTTFKDLWLIGIIDRQHEIRQSPHVWLCQLVSTQSEEIFQAFLSRGHHDFDVGEGFENAIDDLLMDSQTVHDPGESHGEPGGESPGGAGGQSAPSRCLPGCLHAGLVQSPLDGDEGVGPAL